MNAVPRNLSKNPRLGTWLRIDGAGHARVYSGKVEIGQGILTALAQIAADELGLAFRQVVMVAAATGDSPDEAVTSGSLSIQDSGSALRHVCAQARAIYLARAAQLHAVPLDTLEVVAGDIMSGARRISSYWELADDRLLDVDAEALPETRPVPALVGASQPRPDIEAKVFGRYAFIHDLVLPGMVHGRIVRPPSPSARLRAWRGDALAGDESVLTVERDGSLVGVVARTEHQAESGAQRLAETLTWDEAETLPDEADLAAWLHTLPRDTSVLRAGGAPADAAVSTLRASYAKPFLKHASIGPSCALARMQDGILEVWTHSQGIYNLQRDLASALAMPAEAITVRHVQGAGCYGHNGADDVAFDASWLARACPGVPVRVMWSRADELCWSPLSPAMAVDIEADVDAAGNVLAWREQVFSPGHGLRPGRAKTSTLLGAWHLAAPHPRQEAVNAALADGGGSERNAVPIYDFPSVSVLNHRLLDVPVRTSAMRALGAYANVFAIESFMDELAHAGGRDPLAYRLDVLRDPRGIAVLRAAAARASWQTLRDAPGEGRGVGLGFAHYKSVGAYCAVVAQVELTHEVRVMRLVIAVDVGQVINPDGVRQQIEGGAIQATSWALLEAARFDATRITSGTWSDYPILRFSQTPAVEVEIIQSEAHPSVGAGEASLGPTVAAIGNAVFHALGVRVRDLPISPDSIVRAME